MCKNNCQTYPKQLPYFYIIFIIKLVYKLFSNLYKAIVNYVQYNCQMCPNNCHTIIIMLIHGKICVLTVLKLA